MLGVGDRYSITITVLCSSDWWCGTVDHVGAVEPCRSLVRCLINVVLVLRCFSCCCSVVGSCSFSVTFCVVVPLLNHVDAGWNSTLNDVDGGSSDSNVIRSVRWFRRSSPLPLF